MNLKLLRDKKKYFHNMVYNPHTPRYIYTVLVNLGYIQLGMIISVFCVSSSLVCQVFKKSYLCK